MPLKILTYLLIFIICIIGSAGSLLDIERDDYATQLLTAQETPLYDNLPGIFLETCRAEILEKGNDQMYESSYTIASDAIIKMQQLQSELTALEVLQIQSLARQQRIYQVLLNATLAAVSSISFMQV